MMRQESNNLLTNFTHLLNCPIIHTKQKRIITNAIERVSEIQKLNVETTETTS